MWLVPPCQKPPLCCALRVLCVRKRAAVCALGRQGKRGSLTCHARSLPRTVLQTVLRACCAGAAPRPARPPCAASARRVAPAAVDDGDEERRNHEREVKGQNLMVDPNRAAGAMFASSKTQQREAAFLVWCRQRFCAAGHRPLPSPPPLPLAVDGAGAALPQEERWRA
jgi:hypothetical protein